MYPAKLLLFGEYTVLNGSMALALPFSKFKGKLYLPENKPDTNPVLNNLLLDYFTFLQEVNEGFPFKLDLEKLKLDVEAGLYFQSDIPQGYGLGSSGALVAAIYDNYISNKLPKESNPTELALQKSHLAMLEGYFHGSSSGIDPLISYTNWPILIKQDQSLIRLQSDLFKDRSIHLFLVDTHIFSSTRENISLFKQLKKDEYWQNDVTNQITPVVNNCVNAYLNKSDDLLEQLMILSQYQLHYFEKLIPEDFLDIIQQGLNSGLFALKLCGSGGGGFLLGFTHDLAETNKYFQELDMSIILI